MKNGPISLLVHARKEKNIENNNTKITLTESSKLSLIRERFTKRLEKSNVVSIEEYVDEKNDPVLILLACNKGYVEKQNKNKEKKEDLNIYFTLDFNANKYIVKGATKNKMFPGRIDKENPNIKDINKTSINGNFLLLFKKLIDLTVREDINTAIKQLGAIESLLVEKVLVIYKLPRQDKPKNIFVS